MAQNLSESDAAPNSGAKDSWTLQLEQLVFDVHKALSVSDIKPSTILPIQTVNRIKKLAQLTDAHKAAQEGNGATRKPRPSTASSPRQPISNNATPRRNDNARPSSSSGVRISADRGPNRLQGSESSTPKAARCDKGKEAGVPQEPPLENPNGNDSDGNRLSITDLNSDVLYAILSSGNLSSKDLQSVRKAGCRSLAVSAISVHLERLSRQVHQQSDPDYIQRQEVLKAEVDQDLSLAMPVLEAATEALNTLNKNDITEVKSLKRPPSLVLEVLSCVLILLDPKANVDWATMQKMIGSPGFLAKLVGFDKDNIRASTMAKIDRYLQNPNLTEENVRRTSIACTGFLRWVRGLRNYHQIYQEIKPKIAHVKYHQKALEQLPIMKAEAEQMTALLAKLSNEERGD